MSNILIINIPAHGHVNPTLELTKELVLMGHDVTYLAGESFKDKIEKTKAKFIGYKEETTGYGIEGLLKTNITIYGLALEIATNYDCIIYENMFFLGKKLGEQLNKPTVRLITTFALTKNIIEKIDVGTEEELNLLSNKEYRKAFALKYLPQWDFKNNDIMDEVTENPADLNIVYTTSSFQIEGNKFDKSIYKFIGPSIMDRKEDIDVSFDEMNNHIIYVSLGTVYNNSLEFFKTCIEAFKDENVSVIMSIGNNIDKKDLGEIPNNIYIYNYVPQLEVLKHAKLFITHGGMNSTNEGMFFQVPLVIVPQSVDQPVVANRILELGLGKVINKDEITVANIKRSCLEVLNNDMYKRNMENMKLDILASGGVKTAVNEIKNLMKK